MAAHTVAAGATLPAIAPIACDAVASHSFPVAIAGADDSVAASDWDVSSLVPFDSWFVIARLHNFMGL